MATPLINKYERFTCPVCNKKVGNDYWEIKLNGDLCCSNCDSWHPLQFLNFCKSVLDESLENLRDYFTYNQEQYCFHIIREKVWNTFDGAQYVSGYHMEAWIKKFDSDLLVRKLINDHVRNARLKCEGFIRLLNEVKNK